MQLDDTPSPAERVRALARLPEVRRRARRRLAAKGALAGGVAVVVALAVAVPAALARPGGHQTIQVTGRPPAVVAPTTTTTTVPPVTSTTTAPISTTVPSTTTTPSTTTAAATTVPASTVPATTTTTVKASAMSVSLPITVESDATMKDQGNMGPSSSILLPSSCSLSGTTVTATGTYDGGFAPAEYDRFGDVVELYVYTASQSGYPSGIQIGDLNGEHPPAMENGTWTTSVVISDAFGAPVTCQVAAQPTHAEQLAP